MTEPNENRISKGEFSGLLKAIENLTKQPPELLLEDFIHPDIDSDAPSDYDPADRVAIKIPQAEYPFELTIGELKALVADFKTMRFVKNKEVWTSRYCIIKVESTEICFVHEAPLSILKECAPLEFVGEKSKLSVSFISGPTIFVLAVLDSGAYDDFNPTWDTEDKFIKVSWHDSKPPTEACVHQAVNAYLFEIAASFGVSLYPSARPICQEFDDISVPRAVPKDMLRPLITGAGANDLIKIYLEAISSQSTEFSIIGFVKVLEHVSATAVREKLISTVRSKLYSRRVLAPDAEYVLELDSLLREHNTRFKKDSENIKQTIIACCDQNELRKVAPGFFSSGEKDAAWSKLAELVTSTRNQLVHAKVNYRPTGSECPEDRLAEFEQLCKLAAEQAIRWYSHQPENARVIRLPDQVREG